MKNDKKIIESLKNVFENNKINEKSSSENINEWDSVAMINIIMEIEKSFEIKIDIDQIEKVKSYESIKEILINKGVKF